MFSSLKRCALRQVNRMPVVTAIRTKCKTGKSGTSDRCRKIKGFPCGKPEGYLAPKKKVSQVKVNREPSMWLNPFCAEDAPYCPFNPRFDDIYYVESDKAKRRYWQTWVSCPPMKIKKKQICCFAKAGSPPVRRRKHRRPKTACPQPITCPVESACPRVKRRCHRAGRMPPDCVRVKRPLICNKPLTPYPAFSECVRMRPDALPLSECICWKKPMLCEAWAEWRRRAMNKTAKA